VACARPRAHPYFFRPHHPPRHPRHHPRSHHPRPGRPPPPAEVERLVNEASQHDLIDPESLRAYLDGRPREPGVRLLRQLLDRDTFRLSDSELERIFRHLSLAIGLPLPLTKQWLNDFEVDFYWPALSLVVEADSLRYHRTAAKQARDLLRDQTHTAAGLRTLRFSHWQIKHEPRRVESVLAEAAR
jgi:very-short-patch-repair endonuclease